LPKEGVDLPFKSITAGANITLTASAEELEIASTGGGGTGKFDIFPNKPANEPVLHIGFGDSNATGYVVLAGDNPEGNPNVLDLVNPAEPSSSVVPDDWYPTIDTSLYNFAAYDPTLAALPAAPGLNQVGYQRGNRGQIHYTTANLVQKHSERTIYTISVTRSGGISEFFKPGESLNTLIADLVARAKVLVPELATVDTADIITCSLGANDANWLGIGYTPQQYVDTMKDIIDNSSFTSRDTRVLIIEGPWKWNWENPDPDVSKWSGWDVLNAQTNEKTKIISSYGIPDNSANSPGDLVHYSGEGRVLIGDVMYDALINEAPYNGNSLPRYGNDLNLYNRYNIFGAQSLYVSPLDIELTDVNTSPGSIQATGVYSHNDDLFPRRLGVDPTVTLKATPNLFGMGEFFGIRPTIKMDPSVVNPAWKTIASIQTLPLFDSGMVAMGNGMCDDISSNIGFRTDVGASLSNISFTHYKAFGNIENSVNVVNRVGFMVENPTIAGTGGSISRTTGFATSNFSTAGEYTHILTGNAPAAAGFFTIPGVAGTWNMHQLGTENNRWNGGHQQALRVLNSESVTLDGSMRYIKGQSGACSVDLPLIADYPNQVYTIVNYTGQDMTVTPTAPDVAQGWTTTQATGVFNTIMADAATNQWVRVG
jgi:hypothetical protein